MESLIKYEEVSNKKAGEEFEMAIFSGDGKRIDMKEKVIKTGDNMTNPFILVKNWIKGEILDIEALLIIIAKKEAIENMKINAMNKLKNDR